MSDAAGQELLPAEHRALRELHATGRQLARHWAQLAARLGGEPALERGSAAARELLRELEERAGAYGVHGLPAAQGAGVQLANLRGASELLLERNQALRLAVADAQHVATLLAYLGELADTRGDAPLAAWHRRQSERVRALEDEARTAAIATGRRPDLAVEPAVRGGLGRAGHGLAVRLGTLGEAFDGSPLGRRARERRGRPRSR